MGLLDSFLGRSSQPRASEEYLKRQQASQNALSSGGLPLNAIERLQHQRAAQTTDSHLWSSNLSVSELALVGDVDYEPLGQVMGASVFNVGTQWRNPNWRDSTRQIVFGYELDITTEAYALARQRALSRLQKEAELLGAEGVVGVRLQYEEIHGEAEMVEYQAFGTAISRRHAPPPKSGKLPFLCSLSGEEFWKLNQAGYMPVGLAAGNCAYYCSLSWNSQRLVAGGALNKSAWANQELPEFTDALYSARELALERVASRAMEVNGQGVMGTTISVKSIPYHVENSGSAQTGLLFHFFAVGTAIRTVSRTQPTEVSPVFPLTYTPVRSNIK